MTTTRLVQAIEALTEDQRAAAVRSAQGWNRPIPAPDDVDRIAGQIEGWASRPWSTDSSSVSISALGAIQDYVKGLTDGPG